MATAFAAPHQSIGVDGDTVILLDEMQRRPHLADTLVWWHGTWQPIAHYFRPATIFLFWLEYHVFGPNGYLGFMLVQLLSHLVMMMVAFFLLSELIDPIVATVALVIYGTNGAAILNLPDASTALQVWKDSCDIWCSTVYMLSLIFYLKYLRTGRRGWYAGAIAAFVGAICFKEVGYMVPVFMLLILWYERKLRSHWLSVVPCFVLAPLLFLYRTWALHGRGAHTGENKSWPIRWANDGAGLRGGMVSHDYLPLCVVFAVIVVYAMLQRKFLWSAILAVLIVAGCLLSAFQLDMSMDSTLLRFIDIVVYRQAIAAAITVYLYWSFWRFRDRGQIFAYGMVVVTFIPLATQPITSNHALYFVALSWSVFLAFSLVELLDLLGNVGNRFRNPHPGGTNPALPCNG